MPAYETTRPSDFGPNPYFGAAAPPTAAVKTSPGLAFLLGLLPGVGAIYNGQYLKGFIHVAILGVLISIMSSGHVNGPMEPFMGMLIGAWYLYMPFEAFHTAKKREMGLPVDEWSSLLTQRSRHGNVLPVGPVVLIGIGVLFLLDTLGLLPLSEIFRFWPLLLIGIGVYSLYARLSGGPADAVPPPPPSEPPPASPINPMEMPNER
jgi:hypothetical protein